jgi:hypothetical protein
MCFRLHSMTTVMLYSDTRMLIPACPRLLFSTSQQSAALACLEQVDHNIRGMQIAVERATRDAAAGKPALKKRTRRSRRPSRTAVPTLAVGAVSAATPSSKQLSGEHTLPNTPAERAPMSGSTFFSYSVAPPLPPRPVAAAAPAAATVVAPPTRSTMSYAQQWLPYHRDLRSAVVQRPQQQQAAAVHDSQYLQVQQQQQQQLRQVTTLPTSSTSASSSMWSYLGVRSNSGVEPTGYSSRAVQQPMPAISKVHILCLALTVYSRTAADCRCVRVLSTSLLA